jgi:DNA-directed RNA polymerase, mitochondrial
LRWANETDTTKEDRRKAQVSYEEQVLMYSRTKYWDEYNRAPDEGVPEQELLDSSIRDLRDTYQEWIDTAVQSNKTPSWARPLLELGAAKMADITIRAVMRCWFSSSFWGHTLEDDTHNAPLAQTVANLIAQDSADIIAYQNAKSNNKLDWTQQSKFIKNWTEKRCKAFSKKMGEKLKLGVKEKHNFGHNMLRIAATSNIVNIDVRAVKRGRLYKKYSFVEFHPSILEKLHEKHALLQTSTLVYRPMLTPPELHTESASGGYIHRDMRKPVVQRYKSNFWGDDVKDQKFSTPSPTVLDGVNGLMLTEWAVNEEVLDVMTTMFENNSCAANLPAYEFESFMYNEVYPSDGTKVEKAIWCQRRQEVWSEWYKQEQARGRMLVRLQLANDLKKWGYFYQVYTLDFRGRAYTICELLSCQSSDFDKGLVMFANPIKLTDRGLWWLKVGLANLFDQDKGTLESRVAWVDANWEMLKRINDDPYEHTEWIDNRKKKNKSFQRLAAIKNICRTDGMSYLPVQLDGRCNGSQHWSAIMRDVTIAEKTGVIPSELPEDLYQYVADGITDYCVHHKESVPWCDEFLDHWGNNIDRDVAKRPTMCDPYGLTFYGIQKYLKVEGHLDWVSSERQGGAIVELARAVKASMDKCLAAPNEGKDYLKSIVSVANDLNKHIEYTTPSGFKVVHYYNQVNSRRSVAKLFGNKELSFFIPTTDVNKRQALQAIAPNFIHSLDAAHMFLTLVRLLRAGVFSLCFIHDSYGCHANHVDDMRDILREEFLKIHNDNQLENFKRDVQNHLGVMLPSVPEQGALVVDGVLDSEYFFA